MRTKRLGLVARAMKKVKGITVKMLCIRTRFCLSNWGEVSYAHASSNFIWRPELHHTVGQVLVEIQCCTYIQY